MSKDEKDIATETAETIDRIEGLLSGALSFAGRYLATIWLYLRIPSLSAKNRNGEISHDRILYPLSFLTSSLLLFTLSYFRVLKELLDLKWISHEFRLAVDRIVTYHDSIAESAFAFQIAEALFLMVPLVLFVALFAKINELISILLRKQATIDQHLSSCSYFVGTLASMLALWSLPMLYFVGNYKLLKSTSPLEEVIGFVTIILAMGTILTALFRYLQDGRKQYYNSWLLTCLVFVVALFLQIIVMQVTIKLFLHSGA